MAEEQMENRNDNFVSNKLVVDGDVKFDGVVDMTKGSDSPEELLSIMKGLDKIMDNKNMAAITLTFLTKDGSGLPEVVAEEN